MRFDYFVAYIRFLIDCVHKFIVILAALPLFIRVLIILIPIVVVIFIKSVVKYAIAKNKFDEEISELSASRLPAGQDACEYLGSAADKLFTPGYYKEIQKRYGPFNVRNAVGELCIVECRSYGDFTREDGKFVAENTSRAMRIFNSRSNHIKYSYYCAMVFRLNGVSLPEFNLSSSSFADLYNNGILPKGPLAKYFTPKAMGMLVKGLPDVSVFSSGDLLMFYYEQNNINLANSKYNEISFVKRTMAVAEEILAAI